MKDQLAGRDLAASRLLCARLKLVLIEFPNPPLLLPLKALINLNARNLHTALDAPPIQLPRFAQATRPVRRELKWLRVVSLGRHVRIRPSINGPTSSALDGEVCVLLSVLLITDFMFSLCLCAYVVDFNHQHIDRCGKGR